MPVTVIQFDYNSDNYGALVRDAATGKTACIDAGLADPVFDVLDDQGWGLDQLWITHHHWDHTDDLAKIKARTGCHVIGPAYAGSDALALDQRVSDQDGFMLGDTQVRCLHTPGHTLDMINFHLPADNVIFTGDTLFSLGCGRVFEGTHAQMHASMETLLGLPDDTLIYAGHEYTASNAAFAKTIDPENPALHARIAQVSELRAQGLPTLPVLLGDEKATNPFLRFADPGIRAHLNMEGASDAAVFSEIRTRKDRF